MTIMKDIDNSNLVDFLGKECKNLLHDKCCSVWKGYGFQVVCNCECHKKQVLGRVENLSNTCNSPERWRI
jgi:hypothetical protein